MHHHATTTVNCSGRFRLLSVGAWLCVAATLGLVATGCSSVTPAPTATAATGLLAYSQCMRSHGLADFPDPNSQGVIEGKSSSSAGGTPSDLNPNSPTYQAAQKACQRYASGGTSSADQAKQLTQALKFTACMRSHGVTQFPDPTVVDGQIEFNAAAGLGRTPQFATANRACQYLLEAQ
ncbi:MAG TPA: hypothetical protein VHZ98_13185 [Galbitalea sp.]|nr:hypothetical protein [Galbitalea sp.]